MTIRTYLASKIPELKLVDPKTITHDIIYNTTNEGLIHRFLVAIDMAGAVFGGKIQDQTISSRCAVRLYVAEQSTVVAGGKEPPVDAPLWALTLGAALEAIDPGHCQAAILADYCRGIRVSEACS